jgi:butyrate kinase
MFLILALNPGSTSTKIGFYKDEKCIFKETLRHSEQETSAELDREEQAGIRREAILSFLKQKKLDLTKLSVVVVRGGLLKPVASGTYLVNDAVYKDLSSAKYGWHASNLGSIIALPLTKELGIPLYTVDPVTVDEFEPEARLSGLKEIPRLSMSHALNMKAMARWLLPGQEKNTRR